MFKHHSSSKYLIQDTMDNWFYMNRQTFSKHLHDELGPCLAPILISCSFDTPISFMIDETTDEIIFKIQQSFSQYFCRKRICNENCLLCSITLPNYAKLYWFIQRLLIMCPLSKPFIKKSSSLTIIQKPTTNQGEISLTQKITFLPFMIIGFLSIVISSIIVQSQ